MSEIRYEKCIVSKEMIQSYEEHTETVKGTMKAYAAFMALNHYRRLRRNQALRHHHGYLTGVTKRVAETHCTCGLIVRNSHLKTVKKRHGLEPIQLLSGYVRMPEDDGFTAAFITDFIWVEAERDHRWMVFCQGCDLYLEGFPFDEAEQWVLEHEGHLS